MFKAVCLLALSLALPALAAAPAPQTPKLDSGQQALMQRIDKLRRLDHATRTEETRSLALAIRSLAPSQNRLLLAAMLAALSTEGDFGRDTLQQVTTTLDLALAQSPPPPGDMADQYYEILASLARYESMKVNLGSAPYQRALARLAAADRARAAADFTLTGLDGQSWTLHALRGKVVLVNFWATWCPPCRAEMPALQALQRRFGPQGLVILGISDEKPDTVRPYVTAGNYTYPILLDPGDKVEKQFQIDGIPKSFLYSRTGKLVAEAIDMRTPEQFLAMLAKAGLQ